VAFKIKRPLPAVCETAVVYVQSSAGHERSKTCRQLA
jgi:hypothetical protein